MRDSGAIGQWGNWTVGQLDSGAIGQWGNWTVGQLDSGAGVRGRLRTGGFSWPEVRFLRLMDNSYLQKALVFTTLPSSLDPGGHGGPPHHPSAPFNCPTAHCILAGTEARPTAHCILSCILS